MQLQLNRSPSPPPPAATTTATGRLKTSVHDALDAMVNVNALFAMAIFIGFSLTTTSLEQLIVYQVVSFSFFTFSFLIAQSLKLAINLANSSDPHRADVDPFCMKYGLIGSALGSILGCVFLMLSINVDFVQVKLGVFCCGGESVYAAVITLVVLIGSSLIVYVLTVVYALCFI